MSEAAYIETAGKSPTGHATIDEFLSAMRKQATGVTVVTVNLEDRPWGLTISAFSSVCIEPPTLLVCVNTKTVTADKILEDRRFGVNLLSDAQQEISNFCAVPQAPKFVDEDCVPESEKPVGYQSPLLRSSMVGFDCVLSDYKLVGSHLVAFGEVIQVVTTESEEPLLYSNGEYQVLA